MAGTLQLSFACVCPQASVKMVQVMQEDVHTMRVIIERMQARSTFQAAGCTNRFTCCDQSQSQLMLRSAAPVQVWT